MILIPGQPKAELLSSAHALAARLVVLVCCPCKTTQHFVTQERAVLSWFCGYNGYTQTIRK